MAPTMSAADSPPTAPPALSPPRAKAAGRRFRRWHLDAAAPAEEEGWLLTYLDVITLMLVMMVVMLSQAGPPGSQPQGPPDPAPPGTAAAAQAGVASTASAAPALIALPVLKPETIARQDSPAQGLPLQTLGQEVDVSEDANAVRFRLSSEFLFQPGGADLTQAGYPVLDELIPVLNADPTLRLVIEGHTDNTPVRSARFPSNWELSTSRAAAVARYLVEHGVAPQRIQASGFADTRPIGGKDNPVDQRANRRVDLVMEKAQPQSAPR